MNKVTAEVAGIKTTIETGITVQYYSLAGMDRIYSQSKKENNDC